MNLLQHKNFSLASEYIGKIDTTTAEGVLTTHLQELALKLFAKNPSWRFELDETWNSTTTEDKIIFRAFKVMDSHGAKLGRVGTDYRYSYNGDGKVSLYVLHNKRFNRGVKKTASLPTAMRDIQKAFRSDTHDELIDVAMDDFSGMSRMQARQKGHQQERANHVVKDAAYNFVMSADQGQLDVFTNYCERHNKDASNALSLGAKLQLEIKTIEDIANKFDTHQTCLLIRHENSWIMRIADDVKVCNDSSLPNDVRMKLGMLKLVDDDQFIENIGCRVNSYTFVVTLEQGETK
jgi:hypothetical protein